MRVALVCALALLAVAVPAAAGPVGTDPACHNVASGPDAVVFLCVDADAPCRVYTVTYGHEGQATTRCVLA